MHACRLSTSWFGADERTFSTTVAANSTPVGVAVAYLLAPLIVSSPHDVLLLVEIVAICSVVCAVLVVLYFDERPITPPSNTALGMVKERFKRDEFSLVAMLRLFFVRGFMQTVLVFSLAESTLNAFATFLDPILLPMGFSTNTVGFLGVFFIVASMVGSWICGFAVDCCHLHKVTILFCIVGAALGVFWLWLLTSSVMDTSDVTLLGVQIWISILFTGFFIGPLQPLALELASDLIYPTPEATSTALQQVLGNLLSAALVPCMEALRVDNSMSRSVLALFGVIMVVLIVFIPFHGTLRRSQEAANSVADLPFHVRSQSAASLYVTIPAFPSVMAPPSVSVAGKTASLLHQTSTNTAVYSSSAAGQKIIVVAGDSTAEGRTKKKHGTGAGSSTESDHTPLLSSANDESESVDVSAKKAAAGISSGLYVPPSIPVAASAPASAPGRPLSPHHAATDAVHHHDRDHAAHDHTASSLLRDARIPISSEGVIGWPVLRRFPPSHHHHRHHHAEDDTQVAQQHVQQQHQQQNLSCPRQSRPLHHAATFTVPVATPSYEGDDTIASASALISSSSAAAATYTEQNTPFKLSLSLSSSLLSSGSANASASSPILGSHVSPSCSSSFATSAVAVPPLSAPFSSSHASSVPAMPSHAAATAVAAPILTFVYHPIAPVAEDDDLLDASEHVTTTSVSSSSCSSLSVVSSSSSYVVSQNQ